jgi:hypothetical protein
MRRDLAAVIEDLHRGLQAVAERSAMRLAQAETVLPVDCALVLKDGGCALLADVTRNFADASWAGTPSRLVLRWAETPTQELP